MPVEDTAKNTATVAPMSLAEHMAQNSTFGVIMKALAEFEALPPSQRLKLEQERWEQTSFMRRSSQTTPEQGQE
ncbi:MAG: hypothetical protein HGA71_12630 [Azonexaceae bacterium]|nr:hypothetical protein [Azonexaceae bacterium]